ncbi:MAG: hypothetical protein J6T35_02060 [Bacteroidales bacterium]|nr:hypothetical protein [Bacteroidales bacterium]
MAFDVYLEHNGHKFQIHYEAEDSVPCATRGNDWYNALKIMTEDGAFEQITDAQVVGAPTHYEMKRYARRGMSFAPEMEEAIAKFKEFIEAIY